MAPNFSKFRLGEPLRFSSGETLDYASLKKVGLQDHYIRIIYTLVSKGKVAREQVDAWLNQAGSTDRVAAKALRDELESLRSKPLAALKPKVAKKSRAKVSKREKVFTLHSKGNHKKALKLAHDYNLNPAPVAKTALRPGQSEAALSVQAAEHIASKLITTGYWSTAS